MIRRRDRLYDYVRQATQLDEERLAALGDRSAQDTLFEEITQMDTSGQPTSSSPARRRLRPLIVTVAAAVVIAGALAVTSLLGWWSNPAAPSAAPATQPAQSAQPQGDVFAGGAIGSCVETYSPQTLAKRGFAVDATVVSIGSRSTADDVGGDPYVPVVLKVNHWYRGGDAPQITVAMLPPLPTSVDNATYRVGSRLLVSGEDRNGNSKLTDPLAWACGFTRWYAEVDAPTWAQTFR